jgi:cobalt-zinc-cadmium efflux system outer membrane protein
MSFLRLIVGALLATVLLPIASLQAETLHDALESAWNRQPAQRAQTARLSEFEAKRQAAANLTPLPTSISIGQRTDQIGSNVGQRETDIEFSAPLWLPGQRDSQRAVVEAETSRFSATQIYAKWRLAGEVRDIWWMTRLAQSEKDLANQRVSSVQKLLSDVERRVKAGDLAKVDANRANVELQAASIALKETEVQAFRALQQFNALTGLSRLPQEIEAVGQQQSENHPQKLAAQSLVLAQKRLDLIRSTPRDAPELSLGLTHQKDLSNDPYNNSVSLKLKIPFASDAVNQQRLAAAQADHEEADAEQALAKARIEAEISSARFELEQTNASVAIAELRFNTALDTQQLLDRSFNLGESDLPTRLLAESARFEAERSLIKSRLEAGRAISKVNQALGVLP